MSSRYILAVDQGTSGSKSLIFDENGTALARGFQPLSSSFPQPGFVEQDPEEIYQSALASVKRCLKAFEQVRPGASAEISCCGISNQRETFVLWDREGQPVHPAVVWQCKRSIPVCERLKAEGLEPEVSRRTGLILDPYFSASKLIWLLENEPPVKEMIGRGGVLFGTVDSWLLHRLTRGASHLTDFTNAARTLLFNLDALEWDSHLVDKFGLSPLNLPETRPSSWDFGESDFDGILPRPVRITAMAGDSHASSFGQGCFTPGTAKATLGTGSSILLNVGPQRISSENGMVSTICWSTAGRTDFALEGVIVTCGATVQWLRDQLGLFAQSRESETLARSVPDNLGVVFVPAFSGLGAPHWRMDLRGAILGLTFGADKRHIVRAALESIPFQIKDVITTMEAESKAPLSEIKVDGGLTANAFVIQALADLLGTAVVDSGIEDVSALGAACLAGLEAGVFRDFDHLAELNPEKTVHRPGENRIKIEREYRHWKETLQQLLDLDHEHQ